MTTSCRWRNAAGLAWAMIAGAVSAQPVEVPGAPVKAADVLVWTQAQRAARFPHMDRLLPHETVRAGGKVHALPAGRPLALTLMRDGAAQSLDAYMQGDRTAGLLVLQDGKVRLERYGPALTVKDHWASFSVTKSVTSLLFAAAIRDGFIKSLDDTVPTYLPEMQGSAYDGVTIRDLLTMSSGVRWSEDYTDPRSDVARMYATPADSGLDPIVSYMRKLPRAYAPGTHWAYKTGETDLAGILLVRATHRSLARYLSEKIWRPYGMALPAVWMIDESHHSPGGCCLSASLRDLGRLGQFVLEGAKVGGVSIAPPGWLADATTAHLPTGRPGMGYGYFWWVNGDGTYDAHGIFGQGIHIDPRRRLVVVMLAAWPAATDPALSKDRARLLEAIAAAVDGGIRRSDGSAPD